jgi:hypothetical protein
MSDGVAAEDAGQLGYASEVLQKESGINPAKQTWVMMFLRSKNAPWQGSERNRHDPEKE